MENNNNISRALSQVVHLVFFRRSKRHHRAPLTATTRTIWIIISAIVILIPTICGFHGEKLWEAEPTHGDLSAVMNIFHWTQPEKEKNTQRPACSQSMSEHENPLSLLLILIYIYLYMSKYFKFERNKQKKGRFQLLFPVSKGLALTWQRCHRTLKTNRAQ